MTLESILPHLVTALFAAGAAWGFMRSEVAALKRQLESMEDVKERLTKIETKIDILIPGHYHSPQRGL